VRAGSSGVDFSLRFPKIVIGQVLDAATGEPIARMGFRLRTEQGGLEIIVEDTKGRFLVAFPEPLDFEMTAAARGYAESAPERVSLRHEDIKQGVVFRLLKGGTLVGKIRHATGKKIRWARVVAVDPETGDYLGHFVGFLSEDGSFKIEGLPTAQLRIRVTADPDCAPSFFEGVCTVLGGTVFRDFVLKDGGTLELMTQDRIGRGIEDVLVVIKDPKRGAVTYSGSGGADVSRLWENCLYESPTLWIGPDEIYTDSRGQMRYSLLPGYYIVEFYSDHKLCGGTTVEIAEGVTTSKIVVLDVLPRIPKKESEDSEGFLPPKKR